MRARELDAAAAALVEACRSVSGVRQVYVFGSYSRGDVGPQSDLDALIVRETELPYGERQDDIRRVLPFMRTGFDLIVVRPDEYARRLAANSFGTTILREAKLLADFTTDGDDAR